MKTTIASSQNRQARLHFLMGVVGVIIAILSSLILVQELKSKTISENNDVSSSMSMPVVSTMSIKGLAEIVRL